MKNPVLPSLLQDSLARSSTKHLRDELLVSHMNSPRVCSGTGCSHALPSTHKSSVCGKRRPQPNPATRPVRRHDQPGAAAAA